MPIRNMTIIASASVVFSINNMTKLLPATIKARIATRISNSVELSVGNMAKELPAIVRAQVAIIASTNNDF